MRLAASRAGSAAVPQPSHLREQRFPAGPARELHPSGHLWPGQGGRCLSGTSDSPSSSSSRCTGSPGEGSISRLPRQQSIVTEHWRTRGLLASVKIVY